MKKSAASRWVHVLVFAGLLALLVGSIFVVPDLWKDKATGFATVGGFATFYGVIFAAIETARAGSASRLARNAALDARHAVEGLHSVKNIAECQTCIRLAILSLDGDRWTPTSSLSRILELYAAEFDAEVRDENSTYRERVAALQSHAASVAGPLGSRALTRLKDTLLGMQIDLTAAASTALSEKN